MFYRTANKKNVTKDLNLTLTSGFCFQICSISEIWLIYVASVASTYFNNLNKVSSVEDTDLKFWDIASFLK